MAKLSPQKLIELYYAKRIDNTKAIESQYRRLDSLARLLEGTSMCVAVTVVNNRFWIAANKVGQGARSEQGNESVNLINKVMRYFKELAVQDISMDKSVVQHIPDIKARSEVFKLISLQTMKAAIKDNIHIASGADGAAIVDYISGEILANPDILKNNYGAVLIKRMRDAGYKRSKEEILYAYGKLTCLYNDLRKLEHAIVNAKNNDIYDPKKSHRITVEVLEAFKQWEETSLLRVENEKVHAEIKILSEIIGGLKREESDPIVKNSKQPSAFIGKNFYFGISMLCCFKCRKALEAANEILSQDPYNIKIVTRGHHDLWHATWNLPTSWPAFIFDDSSVDYDDSTLDSVGKVITKKLEENFKNLCAELEDLYLKGETEEKGKQNKLEHKSMDASYSSSPTSFSPEPPDKIASDMVKECDQTLSKKLTEVALKLPPVNIEGKISKQLAFARTLIACPSFSSFLEPEEPDIKEFTYFLRKLAYELKKDIDSNYFIEKFPGTDQDILKVELFREIFTQECYVGHNIAALFKTIVSMYDSKIEKGIAYSTDTIKEKDFHQDKKLKLNS